MSLHELIAVLLVLTALLSVVNYHLLRLPTAIGVMLAALLLSLAILLLDAAGLELIRPILRELGSGLQLDRTLLEGMLCYLLFAGGLSVNLENLLRQKWLILLLASCGVFISTLLVGTLSYWILPYLGLPLPFLYCLLFGALIAPTDPVAVIAILRKAGVNESIQAKITGESLFNDGVGVVLFVLLLGAATSGTTITPGAVTLLFLQEAAGGALLGLVLGLCTYLIIRSIDEHAVDILVTLAAVAGGYVLANRLHVSGLIAMVIAGLMLGNRGPVLGLSARAREHLFDFWELLDEILNAILFVLIGLELLLIDLKPVYLLAGLLSIATTLGARWIGVGLPVTLLKPFREFSPGVVKLLTWGGLRGGISIALALSLPDSATRELILTMAYCVVVWSILIQGLSISYLAPRWSA